MPADPSKLKWVCEDPGQAGQGGAAGVVEDDVRTERLDLDLAEGGVEADGGEREYFASLKCVSVEDLQNLFGRVGKRNIPGGAVLRHREMNVVFVDVDRL